MSLFRKIFGVGKNSDLQPPSRSNPLSTRQSPAPESSVGEPIKAFDNFGREILIPRQEWIDNVILPNLKRVWNQPDDLAGFLINAFSDGFFREVEVAAKHLHLTDPIPSRGTALLGIIYLETSRPADAEQLFAAHILEHGEDGVTLTNLAKAQSALGREDESLQTLWHALELDPNQDNGLGWYEVIHREQGGPSASIDALKRIAALPGSWRARLWLARTQLENRHLDSAISLYQEALGLAPRPVPTDLLTQMSGDLGNHGHLPELFTLTSPHFDVETHGIMVGNNLVKAAIDTGQLDSARTLLRELESYQRPDWRQTLDFWESELTKATLEIHDPVPAAKLQMAMLQVNGPLWLKPDHATAALVPPRLADAPHISFLGSSYESVRMPSEGSVQPSDSPGRMSRALPLFLSEKVYLHSDARTTTLIPWFTNDGGGFGLFGQAPDLAEIAHHARQTPAEDGERPADFLVSSHLFVHGENWNLQIALVRTIDSKTLVSTSYDFPEFGFRHIAAVVGEDLLAALDTEAGITRHHPPSGTRVADEELDHYLFRLEQTLAVRCGTMDGTPSSFLSNPAEILDGMVHLSLQNPGHIPSRILLWRCLDGLVARESELVKSMASKVTRLQAEHLLDSKWQTLLNAEFQKVFES